MNCNCYLDAPLVTMRVEVVDIVFCSLLLFLLQTSITWFHITCYSAKLTLTSNAKLIHCYTLLSKQFSGSE